LLTALGGILGYRIFWGEAGLQGVVWTVLGFLLSLFDLQPVQRRKNLLLCAGASVAVAVSGLVFQLQLDDPTPVLIYLLRILLAPTVVWLFRTGEQSPSPMIRHLIQSIWVLALAQVIPTTWLCPGIAVAGALMSTGTFPQLRWLVWLWIWLR
jgi:hypothetical protein